MSTIKPVTIPREVAEVIELLRKGGIGCPPRDNAYICELWTRTGGGVPTATQILRRIPFDTLLSALVNGYERELTEEEKREKTYADIQFMYAHHDNESYEDYSGGFCDGIEYALNTLDIVIPGINDAKGADALC